MILIVHITIMKYKANANTDNFVGFYDFEIEKAERNLAALKARNLSSPEALERNRRNLVKYFDQHDARRGTNFCKTFPEFAELYNQHS